MNNNYCNYCLRSLRRTYVHAALSIIIIRLSVTTCASMESPWKPKVNVQPITGVNVHVYVTYIAVTSAVHCALLSAWQH